MSLVPLRGLAALAALLLPNLPASLGAQNTRFADWPAPPAACLGPDSRPRRAATLLHVVPTDPRAPTPTGEPVLPAVPSAAWQSVALMTEMIAGHARERLGAAEGGLPAFDSTRTTQGFRSALVVVGRRDGSFGWILPWEFLASPTREQMLPAFDTPGLQLLLGALEDMRRSGEPFMWPEELRGVDSVMFSLDFAWPRPDGGGHHDPMPHRHAAAILPVMASTVRYPRPASSIDFVFERYPGDGRRDVSVELAFRIDSTGRVVPGSVTERWPNGEPRATGKAAREHARFLRDVRRTVESRRFIPARVGTCGVEVPYRLVVTFKAGGR